MEEKNFLQITGIAQIQARNSEGFLSSIYQSFIDGSERQANVSRIAASIRAQMIADHREVTRKHFVEQSEIDVRLTQLRSNLLTVECTAKRDLAQYIIEATFPAPTKLKEDRLLRAHAVGIVNSTRETIERTLETAFEEVKRDVRLQDRYRCVCCSRAFSQTELHVHHIIPLYKFGTNDKRNLVTLCYACHNKQHDFKVTRSQPIRRSRAPSKKIHKGTTEAPLVTQLKRASSASTKNKYPRSGYGWMDCPDCLSSIKKDPTENLVQCLECGWTQALD
ncbi:HNH endonuclease [Undibacterium sp.]|uniref:HNH endonuclease n=1 Tax=Undibacterium sp. TaxID=1914977 RepID=UPI0037535E85